MAESVLEVVEKLQSRLSLSAEPRKLQKTLKRLGDLPITVDILVETGIGKTVNGLRKHEFVGDLAKNLVAQWKKLVPQETPRAPDSDEREHNKSSVRKRPRSPSPQYDEEEEYDEELQPVYHSDARHRQPVEPQREFRKEEKHLRHCSDHDDSDNGQAYSPEPSYSPPITYKDRSIQKPSKDHKSSHKEKHQLENRGLNLEKKKDKIRQFDIQKESTSSAGTSHEKLLSPLTRDQPCKKERSRHSESKGHSIDSVNTKKHSHQDKSKQEKHRLAVDMQDTETGKRQVERYPESSNEKREKNKGKSGAQEKKAIKLFVPPSDPDMEDEFEKPTMSFESYLSYDQPQKKKKKTVVKTAAAVPEKTKKKQSNNRPDSSRNKDLPKNKTETSNKERDTKKKESILSKIDQIPVLPDIPLPLIQPNYRPLPSIEPVPFSPNKRKAPLMSAYEEEESAGFTGRRFNSKMQVYSGSKTAYLPKMMSLYEQCIRVLANNIDSIYEVGGVPFSVLEPVLEKCTPDQLYRIEECNHVLVEDTDRLWMNHCQRDFKKDKPDEYESWRELYLRLHEAREQRLLMLTQNIRSAHANKPKGRQAKMAFVNSAVKPPRDVRRRQEKFGTGAAAVNEKTRY